MRGLAIAVIGSVVVVAVLSVIFLLTRESGVEANVPAEFVAKDGVVSSSSDEETPKEEQSLAGRAFDSALFSAEKAFLSPKEDRTGASFWSIAFVLLIFVACILVWIRSR